MADHLGDDLAPATEDGPPQKKRKSKKSNKFAMWEAKTAEPAEKKPPPKRRGAQSKSKNAALASRFESATQKDEKPAVAYSGRKWGAKKASNKASDATTNPPTADTAAVGSATADVGGAKKAPGKLNMAARFGGGGMGINPAALKPGCPPKRGKVGGLAAGLNINLGAMRPGAGLPPGLLKKKREAAAAAARESGTVGGDSGAKFAKPLIPPSVHRRAKTREYVSMSDPQLDDKLRIYLSNHFKMDETKVIPPKYLVLYLKAEAGIDLRVNQAADTDELEILQSYTDAEWDHKKLKKMVGEIIGDNACHKWGFQIATRRA